MRPLDFSAWGVRCTTQLIAALKSRRGQYLQALVSELTSHGTKGRCDVSVGGDDECLVVLIEEGIVHQLHPNRNV